MNKWSVRTKRILFPEYVFVINRLLQKTWLFVNKSFITTVTYMVVSKCEFFHYSELYSQFLIKFKLYHLPSPVYQCRYAFLLNIAVNCSDILLNNSWMAVVLPTKVEDIFSPFGGMSHTAVFTLFGIHSTKAELFLFCAISICSSTSFIDIWPRNITATVR